MSQKYELQAARIESVLSAHKVPRACGRLP